MLDLRICRWVVVLTIVVSTATALPQPVAAADGSWRDSAIPLGESAAFGPYRITVIDVNPDATDEIHEAVGPGVEPEEGNRDVLVRIEVAYLGDEVGYPLADLTFKAVGSANVGYEVYRNTCGPIPDPHFEMPDLENGEATEFNVCWQVAEVDAGSLAMYVEQFGIDAPMWYSLGFDDAQPSRSLDETWAGDADAVTGSSEDDPVPFGTPAVVGDYLVTAIDVVPDAGDLILEFHSPNEPPARGNQFHMVTVEVTYMGPDIGAPWTYLDFYGIGRENPQYDVFEHTCGIIPDRVITTGDVFQYGTVQFNICWQIDRDDADALLVMVEDRSYSMDTERMWFSLAS